VIKYNIITDNEAAGLRVGGYSPGTWYACPMASANRNFNLLYGNHPWNDAQNKANTADCGWYQDGGLSYVSDKSCGQQQYGGCGVGSPPPYWPLINSSDIMDDPLLDTDYTLLPGSPAIGAGPSGTDMGAYGGLDPLEP
jgi:hypothetical protein